MICLCTISLCDIRQYKFNFVGTPRKFIIAKLLIRKLGSSLLLIIAYGSRNEKDCQSFFRLGLLKQYFKTNARGHKQYSPAH